MSILGQGRQYLDGDNTFIERDLICSFYQQANILGKTKDELECYSFLPIANDFN